MEKGEIGREMNTARLGKILAIEGAWRLGLDNLWEGAVDDEISG